MLHGDEMLSRGGPVRLAAPLNSLNDDKYTDTQGSLHFHSISSSWCYCGGEKYCKLLLRGHKRMEKSKNVVIHEEDHMVHGFTVERTAQIAATET